MRDATDGERPPSRRDILGWILGWAGGLATLPLAGEAAAQAFPSRPIRIVVPFPAAGGPLDTAARTAAEAFRIAFGHAGIIENKAGAGGVIGAESVFRAAPDGHTLLCGPPFMFAVGHLINSKATFDARQFEPMSMVAQYPAILAARSNLPINTPAELIAHARANPGKLSYGSQGVGTIGHLTLEQIKHVAKVDILHVPFRGSAPAVTELMSGNIDVLADTELNTRGAIEAGKIKPIGVATPTRMKSFPNVPAIGEVLPGFESITAVGVVAPPGTPTEVTRALADVIRQALARAELRQSLEALGLEPLGTTPDGMRSYLAGIEARWAPVIEAARIRIE